MTTEAIILSRRAIAAHSKSFALASRLLPPRARDHGVVVYAWCRRADDAIDDVPAKHQAQAVQRLRAELDAIYAGVELGAPELSGFADVVRACAIPRAYPGELIEGMAMDAAGVRYDTLDDLLLYCYRVAGTVGLMMSHVMGVRDDAALRHAAHLGIAMQLTNICRDVVEDWDRGRLYVPRDVRARHGVASLEPAPDLMFPRAAVAPMSGAVRELLAVADRFYASGDRGLGALPWRSAVAVRAARLIYAAIGDRIEDAACDVTAGRAVVPAWRKLALAARAVGAGLADLPRRALPRRGGFSIPSRTVEFPDGILPC